MVNPRGAISEQPEVRASGADTRVHVEVSAAGGTSKGGQMERGS